MFKQVFLSFFLISTLMLATHAQAQTVSAEISAATQMVIRDQISAFQSGDHERAYSHAAPSIKQIFQNTDMFINMVKNGYKPLYNPDTFIMGRNIDISGLIHQEVIATDQKGKQWQAVYTLKQQSDGSWKITGVKMEPFKGAST